MSERTLPFNDLALDDADLAHDVDEAIRRVIASSWFVLGPEVEAFEAELCQALGVAHGVGVASGTDALSLSLVALGIGPGDEVLTSPLTAAFTALAISRVGARPVFADVEEDFLTLSPASVEERITARTRAVIPVHLYGNACDMEGIGEVAVRHGLSVVEDACQAHGARYRGTALGALGACGAFSFYPTKNLGALGDGGLVTTSDTELAAALKRLRNGGQSTRYVHQTVGFNSRLDELQAAILRAKLPRLDAWNQRRRALARRYETALASTSLAPVPVREGCESARHLFVVRTPSPEALMAHLDEGGVQTLVHYPVPVHLQPAYRDLGLEEGSCPVAERAARSIVSLPLYPSMSDADCDRVIDALRGFD